MTIAYEDLARAGYQAYGDHTGWLNHLGLPMPRWDALPEETRRAWEAAAQAVGRMILNPGGRAVE